MPLPNPEPVLLCLLPPTPPKKASHRNQPGRNLHKWPLQNLHPARSPRPTAKSPTSVPSLGPALPWAATPMTTQFKKIVTLSLGHLSCSPSKWLRSRAPVRAAELGLKPQLSPEATRYPIWAVATLCISFGVKSLAGLGTEGCPDWGWGVGRGAEHTGKQSYRIIQGFLSLKGFSEAGTPTSRGSFRACCSQ